MVLACYAKQQFIPALAILLCCTGFAVAYAEAPKDYTAPPKESVVEAAAAAVVPSPGATT